MRISGFILVIDSYLVRKGVASILNHIQGARVVKEFDAADPFGKYCESQGVEFLIISQALFDQLVDLFLSRSDLLEKTIIMKDGPGSENKRTADMQDETHAYIHLLEGKEEIRAKIVNLLSHHHSGFTTALSAELTQRERTIVRLVSMGMTNRQIAEELFLSTHTVTTHRKNISNKLGIKSVSGLTVYAIVNNIITIEEVSSKPAQ
jgi:DNA-binding NarL/FixJ family response regulator